MMRSQFFLRLHDALARARRGDRGSALVMAILLMLLFAVAGVTLATVIGVNARVTLQTAQRGISVYAAEAGLETTLSMLHSATTTAPSTATQIRAIDSRLLPCQVAGSTDGSSDPSKQYTVTVLYGMNDPSAHATDAAWLASSSGYAPVSCAQLHAGTQAQWALVESAALQGEVGARTLLATYQFQTDTSHSENGQVGGEILVYQNSALCLRAASQHSAVTATAGSLVYYASGSDCDRTRSAADSKLLGWIYEPDYTIRLASTVNTGSDLCIAGPVTIPTTWAQVTTVQYYWDWSSPGLSWTYQTQSSSGTKTSQSGGPDKQDTRLSSTAAVAPVPQPTVPPATLKGTETGTGFTTNPMTFTGNGTTNGTAGTRTQLSSTTTGNDANHSKVTTVKYSTVWNGWTYTVPVTAPNRSTLVAKTTSPKVTITNAPTNTKGNVEVTGTLKLIEVDTTSWQSSGGGNWQNGSVNEAVLVDCATGNTTDSSGATTGSSHFTNALSWGWEADNTWQNVDGYCLYSGSTSAPAAGRILSVKSGPAVTGSNQPAGCGDGQTPYASFAPEPAVAAGNATFPVGGDPDTGYVVNFQQFGRCIDIQSANPSNKLIVYPCKQNPLSPTPAWNQAVTYDEAVQPSDHTTTSLSLVNGSTTYCIVPPSSGFGSISNTSATSPRIQLTSAGGCSTAAGAQWTRTTWTGRYADSYRFTIPSSTGTLLCLTANHTGLDQSGSWPWATLTAEPCVPGDPYQKWNAPATLPYGGLGDFQEIPN